MKKILCFGDSNTYGFNPKNGERFNSSTRWSGILKSSLKDNFLIIEQGCNNRTCFSDNPNGEEMTGCKAITKYLSTDIDYLVISLGVNDLQKFYNNNEESIRTGFSKFLEHIYSIKKNLKIIVLIPSKITDDVLSGYFSTMFDEHSIELSNILSKILIEISKKYNCKYINLDTIANVSKIDGLHYDEISHKTIANTLYDYIVNLT